MAESADSSRKLRVRAGLGFVQVLRPALYALLVASALFTFWAGGEMAHEFPHWAPVVAPTLFALFLVIFTVYRLALVRAKRYPAAIGFFQIGLGALIWVLLLPSTRQKIGPHPASGDEVPALLAAPDPRVRALAAEVAGFRGDGKYAAQLIDHLADADASVRKRAREALVRMNGGDLAPGEEGAAAQEKWRAAAKRRGWLP